MHALNCIVCGYRVEQAGDLSPRCTKCGHRQWRSETAILSPADVVLAAAARTPFPLNHNDRKFLKSIKISAES